MRSLYLYEGAALNYFYFVFSYYRLPLSGSELFVRPSVVSFYICSLNFSFSSGEIKRTQKWRKTRERRDQLSFGLLLRDL